MNLLNMNFFFRKDDAVLVCCIGLELEVYSLLCCIPNVKEMCSFVSLVEIKIKVQFNNFRKLQSFRFVISTDLNVSVFD